MEFAFTKDEAVTIIKISGNLFGEQQTKELTDQLLTKINEGEINFIVDLSDMKFINSVGLNFLLMVLTKARKANGEAYLVNISDQLSKLLVITKLNAVFNVAEDINTAKELLGNPAN